jgi:hypothetical protein
MYRGCPREYTPRLFECLQQLAGLHGSYDRAIEVVKTYQEIWGRKQGVPPGYRSGELTILQQLRHRSLRPWWQRLWVVQEAVLPQSSFYSFWISVYPLWLISPGFRNYQTAVSSLRTYLSLWSVLHFQLREKDWCCSRMPQVSGVQLLSIDSPKPTWE